MVELIPPPDPLSLLPPFLACLPIAFASTRPPPALGPLLSPILRQRVNLLNSTNSSSSNDTWLTLLSWDHEKASALQDIVQSKQFEPHPVSGELELGDVENMSFKRLDRETLRAQVPIPEWDMTAIYVWCGEDDAGKGWKVAELLPYDQDLECDRSWSASTTEATNLFEGSDATSDSIRRGQDSLMTDLNNTQEQDDSDYWAQYDRTPGRTPSNKRSPAPAASNHLWSQSEQVYYARYSSVQPAMDSEDPDEQSRETGDGSLDNQAFASIMARSQHVKPVLDTTTRTESAILGPQPSPPLSRDSDTVAKLEETAEYHSLSEVGVRQHIGSSIKSMYRLARSCGMERAEFARIVERELEVLGLLGD
ncbi:MAG: hypothetical protein Q9227_008856 [Pyrenula ochraceoflavens]